MLRYRANQFLSAPGFNKTTISLAASTCVAMKKSFSYTPFSYTPISSSSASREAEVSPTAAASNRQVPLPPIVDAEVPAAVAGNRRNLPRVVVVGTGWGGSYFSRTIDPEKFNVTTLSQRNHMLFTPLLPQTATGTLEFRSICEPVLRIQPSLAHLPNRFLQSLVWDVDFDRKAIQCVAVGVIGTGSNVHVESFEYHYDYLVLAHGARPNTFNIPGVEEHAFFLREITEARGIRRRIVSNITTAALPTTSLDEVHRLLHVVVVGGGPTGVEFAGDLADFLKQDIPKLAPNLKSAFRVTLVEANEVLGTFDLNLRKYGVERLQKMGIEIRKAVVAEVTDKAVILTDGTILDCGLVVWSTGVGPSSLNKALKCDKTRQGRLAVDEHLRILRDGKPVPNAFALGDCAADVQNSLPTLAAVASRQGKYLASTLNQAVTKKKDVGELKKFTYTHLLSMASLGSNAAVVEVRQPNRWDIRGISAWLMWRSAYFTMLGSIRSRLYVIVNWIGTYVFGRDVTYIAEMSESKLWKKMAQEGASKEQTRRRLLQRSLEERAMRELEAAANAAAAEEKKAAESAAAAAAVAEQKKAAAAAAAAAAAEEKKAAAAALAAAEEEEKKAAAAAAVAKDEETKAAAAEAAIAEKKAATAAALAAAEKKKADVAAEEQRTASIAAAAEEANRRAASAVAEEKKLAAAEAEEKKAAAEAAIAANKKAAAKA